MYHFKKNYFKILFQWKHIPERLRKIMQQLRDNGGKERVI